MATHKVRRATLDRPGKLGAGGASGPDVALASISTWSGLK